MNKKEKEIISQYMSELGKRARQLKPYPREHYEKMQVESTKSKKIKKVLKDNQ